MIKIGTIALLMPMAFTLNFANADCSFDAAASLTQQLIENASQQAGYSYHDVKSGLSKNNETRITEVLFTYTAEVPNETLLSQNMIGYAHYDASCNSVDSLIINASPMNVK